MRMFLKLCKQTADVSDRFERKKKLVSCMTVHTNARTTKINRRRERSVLDKSLSQCIE
jgi:hypothetical protein